MQPTVLQFATQAELAIYARKIADKGFQINTLNLTLKTKLSEEEVKLARQQFRASTIERLYS
ncbi:MAG TPA: hypothetical protein VGN63_09745 [Flavisolibacter sp.]|jgi:hypothetical protein|nr:hypothetical protein [Flavisolibacter sp.]